MTFETIKRNYDRKLWNKQMVSVAVNKGIISVQEYFVITNDTEFLKNLVQNEAITVEQYEEITGEDYAV